MENINRLSEVELERIDQLLKENSVDDNEVCQEDLDLEEQQYADMILQDCKPEDIVPEEKEEDLETEENSEDGEVVLQLPQTATTLNV